MTSSTTPATTPQREKLLGLDVGEKRIGLAMADSEVKLAFPVETLLVDGSELDQITKLVRVHGITTLVVGLPRNQSGEETAQSAYARAFASRLEGTGIPVVFQDESLTSVEAERRLKSYGKPYEKSDIDKIAASIILQDYMEQQYGE